MALGLPPAAVAALTRFRDAAADPEVWRPLAPETFHVTLAFLGARTAAEPAARVLAELGAVAPPPLALGEGLLLPPRRGRVLTVAVADPRARSARSRTAWRARWRRWESSSRRRGRSSPT